MTGLMYPTSREARKIKRTMGILTERERRKEILMELKRMRRKKRKPLVKVI